MRRDGAQCRCDGDLTLEGDLERFAGLYHSGPNGIFLKRGKDRRIAFGGPFPFVRLTKRDRSNANRLYYAGRRSSARCSRHRSWDSTLNGL